MPNCPGTAKIATPGKNLNLVAPIGTVLLGLLLALRILNQALLLPLGIRRLGPEMWGIWILVQSTTSYLYLLDLGIGQTTQNLTAAAYSTRDRKDVARVVATSVLAYLSIAAVGGVLISALLLLFPLERWLLNGVAPDRQTSAKWLLWLSGLLALGRLPSFAFTAALTGSQKVVLRVLCDIGSVVATFGATAGLLITGFDLRTVIWGAGLTSMLYCVVPYWVLARTTLRHSVKWKLGNISSTKTLVRTSVYYFGSSLAVLIQKSAPTVLASALIGVKSVIYIYALQTVFRAAGSGIVDSLSRPFQPYATAWHIKDNQNRLTLLFTMLTKVSVFVALMFSVPFVVFGQDVFVRWLGVENAPRDELVLAACLGFIAESWLLAGTNIFSAFNKPKALTWFYLSYAAMSVLGGAVGCSLLKSNRALGLVSGVTVVASIAAVAGVSYLAQREFSVPPRVVLKELLARPISAFGAIVALFLVTHAFETALVPRLFCALCCLAVTFSITFGKADREWITGNVSAALNGILR